MRQLAMRNEKDHTFINRIQEIIQKYKPSVARAYFAQSSCILVPLQLAHRLLYLLLGLIGIGLRKGFSPLISHNLWKVYAVPKILYGLEVMPIKKKEMEQMEIMLLFLISVFHQY
jgi:hypothetical protein